MSQGKSNTIAQNTMTKSAAGKMNAQQIRKTVGLYITKKGSEGVIAMTTDIPMSIGQKTVLSLPPVNENDIATRIVSVDQVSHNGAFVPVVTYTGILTYEASAIIAELAPTCASMRGGYFPGHALLSDTKIKVGETNAPAQWKNMIVLHKKNALLFSVGKTLQEISAADFIKQQWRAAKAVSQLNSQILFIGRPSEDEKNVFVVTESSILTVDISNYKSKEVKTQPSAFAQKAIAFFKDGKTFVSVLNDGSLELTSAIAA